MAVAQAEDESAKAAGGLRRGRRWSTELRAPFDVIVVSSNVWKGDVVYKTLQQEPLIVVRS